VPSRVCVAGAACVVPFACFHCRVWQLVPGPADKALGDHVSPSHPVPLPPPHRVTVNGSPQNFWFTGCAPPPPPPCTRLQGLACTDPTIPFNYLNFTGGKFDLVHFNYGLHDLVAACVNGTTGECEEHVPLEVQWGVGGVWAAGGGGGWASGRSARCEPKPLQVANPGLGRGPAFPTFFSPRAPSPRWLCHSLCCTEHTCFSCSLG
jgi:hypothetical protein